MFMFVVCVRAHCVQRSLSDGRPLVVVLECNLPLLGRKIQIVLFRLQNCLPIFILLVLVIRYIFI